ncbi:hypothetical protein AR457_27170 [Streptomyces agglomeratus]|uniref:Uncharacterized protein n=1 Tax=Streptomyces agglomeratus TaxID=285458 RepID=A0A1E5PDJ4_9ACTN|nr:hypothetical protein [Streptomyces agglomeratus]OEJ27596.1 hypothetical protein AS594_27040 [Streptomyces agglomeratus]OEJ38345.1 hypothetical protein BGK70_09485 [Streptomyces agglomeratus]OEJ47271.1 hypothetical protein AR457_27170 [Streptomyces agglomeratus]OEJ50873.1 hypothetical protein BGK72_08970 [Streptomyces agglomeratus]OEJ58236.1 hypothetical protein BGM19_09835 [Streptomyces agglomeratus]
MHSYDPSRHQPYQSQIPAMRPSRETRAEPSHTPIYDALYSEYRRSFRALPGDRSGEEELGFTGFGQVTRHGQGSGPANHTGQGTHGAHTGFWRVTSSDGNGRQHTGNHLPAALPPAPRRGF